MVIWTPTEMAGQKGCCGGPTYYERAGQSRVELGCAAEGPRNTLASAARTLLTAQDQQRLICVQYDLLNTCISVMDGVVIYIVAYVDIQVTRFDSILPVKGNRMDWRKQTAPSVTRVQAKGRTGRVVTCHGSISEHIHQFLHWGRYTVYLVNRTGREMMKLQPRLVFGPVAMGDANHLQMHCGFVFF